ncbi:secreted antigen 3 [Babesia divergens]|uniref:Secreted antigen 3 n=1 Tax=Babesia divergens TaxID=32595 RepID=A0AAD9LD22_BABDI|nr:secreted antigen 3 [Babesia divergens]
MSEKGTCNFKDPETLKDILELLHKIGTARGISGPVLGTLEEEAKKYFKDGSEDSGLTSSLGTVFTNAQSIRESILETGRTIGTYNNFESAHRSHEDCPVKISNALKKCLPKAYAALLFMLFNCDGGMTKYSLGAWSGQKVNDSGVSNNDLCNWLTKEEKTLSGGTKPFTPGLVKRGFSDGELDESNTADNVAENIKQSLGHDSAGSLQNVLCGFMFSCPWDDALTGHACLFLHKFCSEVSTEGERLKGKFKGYSEELKDVCLGLQSSLQPFVSGSSQSHILAVSQKVDNVYSGVFKNDSLDAYCDWLKRNLQNIIQSLNLMSEDCKNWGSPHSFEWGYTAGPFLYGFVPKDKSWMNHIKENLPPKIKSLTASLEKLEKALQTSSSVSSSSSSSAGATAGGVFTGILGTGGLGAGAAYGLNLFGFKNLVTSLISSLLK